MNVERRLNALEMKLLPDDDGVNIIIVKICERGEDGKLKIINTWTLNSLTGEQTLGEWKREPYTEIKGIREATRGLITGAE